MSWRPTTPQLCLLLTQLLAGSCLDILFRRTSDHLPPLQLSCPRLNCSCRLSAGSAELGSAPAQLQGGSGDVAGYVAETGLVVRLNLGKHPPPYRAGSGAGSNPADVEVRVNTPDCDTVPDLHVTSMTIPLNQLGGDLSSTVVSGCICTKI